MPLAVFENQCFPPSTIYARGVAGVLTVAAVSSGSWCFVIFSITAVTVIIYIVWGVADLYKKFTFINRNVRSIADE